MNLALANFKRLRLHLARIVAVEQSSDYALIPALCESKKWRYEGQRESEQQVRSGRVFLRRFGGFTSLTSLPKRKRSEILHVTGKCI